MSIQEVENFGRELMIRTHLLPRKIIGATKDELIARNFIFGPNKDDLFVEAVLPSGWRLEKYKETQYWTHILDADGQRQGDIFYKAASYDRDAEMSILKESDKEKEKDKDKDKK